MSKIPSCLKSKKENLNDSALIVFLATKVLALPVAAQNLKAELLFPHY